jgi:hypothetical protein
MRPGKKERKKERVTSPTSNSKPMPNGSVTNHPQQTINQKPLLSYMLDHKSSLICMPFSNQLPYPEKKNSKTMRVLHEPSEENPF